MRQTLTLSIVLFLLPTFCLAQQINTNPVELPSTSVWEFMKTNNTSANLHTGTISVAIPIYAYEDHDFSIPLSLSYSSNGFKPNIPAGVVGHEWALNAGGAITRTIRGRPDEERNLQDGKYGFLETYHYGQLESVTQLTGFNTRWDNPNIEATTPQLYYSPLGYDNPNYMLDFEPDIFQFNFLGYSGKFQLGYGGEIHFYDTNTQDSEFRLEVPRYNLNEIVIITGNGYRYTFGTGNAREYHGNYGTSWKLSQIQAPNGRTVEFNYTTSVRQSNSSIRLKYDRFNTLAPSSQCYTFRGQYTYDEPPFPTINIDIDYKPIAAMMSNPIFSSGLNSITFDNGTTIDFYYKNLPQSERGSSSVGLNILPKLDKIIVSKPNGIQIKECSLDYSFPPNSSSNKLPFLSSITLSGEGTYSMSYEYDNSTIFPLHGTFQIDHWGYYNGSSVTPTTFYTHTTQDNYLNETITTTLREPNAYYAKIGMLKSITYPTGGHTEFEYEAHNYSKYYKSEYPDFGPTDAFSTGTNPRTAGGLRIKSIRDYTSDNNTVPAYSRSYTYIGEDGKSSGTLAPLPRYGLSYNKTKATGDDISIYLGSYNDLLPSDGTHIDYTKVIETLPEGRNEYTFTSYEDYPDYKEQLHISHLYNYSYHITVSPNLGGTDATDYIVRLMSPLVSLQSIRGKLIDQKTYNSNGTLVSTKENEYENIIPTDLAKIWTMQSFYIGAAPVPTRVGDIRQIGTKTIEDGMTAIESYEYDSFRNLKSHTKLGKTDRYLYVQNLENLSEVTNDIIDKNYWVTFKNEDVAQAMLSRNMLKLPLQQQVYDKEQGLVIQRYEYSFFGNNIALQSIKQYDEQSATWKTSITIPTYNSDGQVVETLNANNERTIYIWGYNGLYLIAQIQGVTLTEVRAISGLSNIHSTPLEGSLSPSTEAALRALTGAIVTTWQYEPLVGLTQETTPDGRSTHYSYTPSGKLQRVLDDLGRLKSKQLYSTDDKQESRNTQDHAAQSQNSTNDYSQSPQSPNIEQLIQDGIPVITLGKPKSLTTLRAPITPSTNSLTWSANDTAEQAVYILCDDDWEISIGSSNFICDTDSGSGPDFIHIAPLSVNTSPNPKTATLTMSSGSDTATISLTQLGNTGPEPEIINLPGNWIISRTQTSPSDSTLFTEDITFYNGLGLPEQIVQVSASKGSPSTQGRNIVTPIVYDAMLRQDAKAYLPYVSNNTNRAEEPLSSVLSAQASWYNANGYSGQGLYANSRTEFDSSPLSKVSKTYKPGSNQSGGTNSRAVNYSYSSNANNEVRSLSINANGDLAINGYIAAGTLRKTSISDEDNCTSISYEDALGRPIMTRSKPDNNTNIDSYYVYDSKGRLAWVISPEGSELLVNNTTWAKPANTDINNSNAAKYCYIYSYDGLGRQISRKLPGRAIDEYVYDRSDKLVMSRDAAQKAAGLWLTISYDDFGRETEKRLLSSGQSRDYFQNLFNTDNHPTSVYPTNATLLSKSTYDSYSDCPVALAFNSSAAFNQQADETRIRGLLTIQETAQLGSSISNTTGTVKKALYYDTIGKLIQTAELWPDGKVLRISYKYDFLGNITQTNESYDSYTKRSTFTYDNRSRLITESSSVIKNNQSSQTATISYAYDPLGRPVGKTMGSGSTAITVSDTFGIEGWLRTRSATQGTPGSQSQTLIFTTSLHYSATTTPRYSGDISKWQWKQGSTNAQQAYLLSYDSAHRLTASARAENGGLSSPKYSETDISYDRAGNLLTLKRYGANIRTPLNNLSFSYNGNRRSTNSYDDRGSITHDHTNSMRYSYGLLELPTEVRNTNNTLHTSYSYLADGTLTQTTDATNSNTRKYRASMVFDSDNNLINVNFASGAISRNSQGQMSNIDYYITDHLGSIRAVIRNGAVVERNDYYPYGTRISDSSLPQLTSPDPQTLRYSGKEAHDAYGHSANYYGARFYTRSAQWLSQDPLVPNTPNNSPYTFCNNNPIKFIDPDGTHTVVELLADGTYKVIDGELDDDYNIYLKAKDPKNIIGRTPTISSFYDSDSGEWRGTINPKDESGYMFISKMFFVSIISYINNARNQQEYDFKATNGNKLRDGDQAYPDSEYYRGMPIIDFFSGKIVYTSARDIGNIVAGHMVGRYYIILWSAARKQFDNLQNENNAGAYVEEGFSSQNAQYYGYQAAHIFGSKFKYQAFERNIIKKQLKR